MSDVHVLSRSAYERLQAEHDDLTTRGRIEIAQAIETARELGDLSENGDYHAAKDQQGRMEARIRELDAILEERRDRRPGRGRDGGTGHGRDDPLRRRRRDDAERYLVGHIEERHDELDVISPGSPLGAALLGHGVGHWAEYEAPNGTLKVKILAVEVV